jgi:cell division protein FtsW (lipid II flippase)
VVKTKPKNKPKKGKKKKGRKAAEPGLSLKEQLAQKRQADRLRKEFISFTASALGFALLMGGLAAIAGGLKAAVGAIVAILTISLSFKYPRQALWSFLIYLPLGGTVIYALGNSPILQLAKEGFYIPALLGVVQYCRREKLPILIPKQLIVPMGIMLTCCVLTLLFVNGYQQFVTKPGGVPLGLGIFGIKILLGYAPLMVCAYYLLRDRQDFLFLMRLSLLLIIFCCGLGLIQYLMLLTGICQGTRLAEGSDLFRASLGARCFVGGSLLYSPSQGVIRLPGTFVAPWQWGWFLIASAFIAFPTAFNDPKPTWRILGLVGLGAVFVMAVVSGQRIALALVPVVVAVLLIFTGQIANLKRFLPIAIGLGLALGIGAVNNAATVQERIDSFMSRWNASPPYDFILQQFQWSLARGGFLGRGLGRATNSGRFLGETVLVETYYPKLIYEIGILGTVAFLILVTTLTIVTFKAYRSGRDRTLRSYGSALWLFIFAMSYNTYYYPLDVDPVAVYYWFFAGVVLKLPEIEKQEKREAKAQDLPEDQPQRRLKRAGFG